MNFVRNPYRATLGANPPMLVGREEEIEECDRALRNGPGTHERISLVSGPRGVGKTVLLNKFEEVGRSHSWWVISETASHGFIERLRDAAYQIAVEQLRSSRTRIRGISLPHGFGVTLEDAEKHSPKLTLRAALTDLLTLQAEIDRHLGQEPVGVFITLDELHHSQRDEVIEFGTTIQHLVREDREIAVAMAGIPSAVKPLLASDAGSNPVTFLRRANMIELGLVSDDESRRALEEPLLDLAFSWEPAALDQAVKACAGYPFMIQLVGQEAFLCREGNAITASSVARSLPVARRKLGQLVHEPALADLSEKDRQFLAVMARNDGPTRTSDIADHLGVGASYVSVYRARLIEAGIIAAPSYGHVDFELPYLRDYIRNQEWSKEDFA